MKKNKVGRPATGRKRDKQIKFYVTEKEKNFIGEQLEKYNMNYTEYFLMLANKFKKE